MDKKGQVSVCRNLFPPENAFVLGSKTAPPLQFGNRLLQKEKANLIFYPHHMVPPKSFQETI